MKKQSAERYTIKDHELHCPICSHDHFYTRHTLMGTAGKSLFDVNWMNPEADNYICEQCGYVLWFLEP
ncbi:hypothetical protein [Ferroacidibacillus organovorans]|uniref:DNA-binding protein n=1 Tax=Ferroacidibacillus organovorans TaxID=1765683 RepID=A0A162RTI2_9BACL|nr:hypothetical protein [Ferroacidibacillus organovorans]KYP79243.1 hypothetical protein AYJ22_15260 [Ferroacidibacillus organovorans]OAG87761.1 hypothetical protein AYW79_14715 [Ferroacidibacillus organovorans]OPG15382.1 hypothetical protein B2M26_12160 [Ferroacidibacillus organovorans]